MKTGIRIIGSMAAGLLVASTAAQPAFAAPGYFDLASPARFEFSVRDRDEARRDEREARKEKKQERKDFRKQDQEGNEGEFGYGYGYERRQPAPLDPRFDRRDRR